MKNIIYFTFLISTLSIAQQPLMAQDTTTFEWTIPAKIPATAPQAQPLGLAGASSGEHNGMFILAGGTNFPEKMPWMGGAKKYYDQVYLYNAQLKLSNLSFRLPFNIAYAASISTVKGLLMAGGENENGLSKKVLLLSWQAEGEILRTSFLADLPLPLTAASMTVIDHTVYLAGGEFIESSSDRFYSLDLSDEHAQWQVLAKLPQATAHAVLLSRGEGKTSGLYLFGGRRKNPDGISTIYSQVYCYDIALGRWTEKSPMPHPLAAASGLRIGNDCYIFSGDEGITFHKTEKLIAAIKKETDPLKKDSLNKLKITLQSTHPGFSKSVLKYNSSENKWHRLQMNMPYGTVTTSAVRFGGKIIIAGGEIKAGVRTASILMGKITGNERK